MLLLFKQRSSAQVSVYLVGSVFGGAIALGGAQLHHDRFEWGLVDLLRGLLFGECVVD